MKLKERVNKILLRVGGFVSIASPAATTPLSSLFVLAFI